MELSDDTKRLLRLFYYRMKPFEKEYDASKMSESKVERLWWLYWNLKAKIEDDIDVNESETQEWLNLGSSIVEIDSDGLMPLFFSTEEEQLWKLLNEVFDEHYENIDQLTEIQIQQKKTSLYLYNKEDVLLQSKEEQKESLKFITWYDNALSRIEKKGLSEKERISTLFQGTSQVIIETSKYEEFLFEFMGITLEDFRQVDNSQLDERIIVKPSEAVPINITPTITTKEKYRYLFCDYYFSDNGKDNSVLSAEHLQSNKKIHKIKEGKYSDDLVYTLLAKLMSVIPYESLKYYTLCVIPASTQEGTILRFKHLCEEICRITKMKNGFEYIYAKWDREEMKGKANKDILKYLIFYENKIKNSNIILLDDVITTGQSFIQCAEMLSVLNAGSVMGLFIAKTKQV